MKQFIFLLYLRARYLLETILSFNHRAIRNALVARAQAIRGARTSEQEDVLFLCAFRVNHPVRQKILARSLRVYFEHIQCTYDFSAIDSSDESFRDSNRTILRAGAPSCRLNLRNLQAYLAEAYRIILTDSQSDQFMMIFDDMPVVGLTDRLISAAAELLSDFQGLVDVVTFMMPERVTVDHEQRAVLFDPISRYPRTVGEVDYYGYRFAIVQNPLYGFYMNNLIANRSRYLQLLSWYIKRTGSGKHGPIEKLGMYRVGPIFRYVAIPLQACMIDLDFQHTESTVRTDSGSGQSKLLFSVLEEGYRALIKG